MSDLEAAQIRFRKADHIYRIIKVVFGLFVIGVFIVLMVQLYNVQRTIARNQIANAKASNERFTRYTQDNARQHAKTQAYVRCIANTLLQPIDTRTEIDFSNCKQP